MQTATIVFAFALLACVSASQKTGDCGIKKAAIQKRPESKVFGLCQICEDLVEVAEMYAHCEE
uniref:Saposin B-type domain-containing protein n=1 Tax=Plectus sambesii TaxID=2011161 RepID=A0A914WQJ9_9BILA